MVVSAKRLHQLAASLLAARWLQAVLVLLVASGATALQVHRQLDQERAQSNRLLNGLRLQLERPLRESQDATEALAAVADAHFDRQAFDRYARRSALLLSNGQALQWSPDGILRFQFPRDDGPQIGLNLRADSRNRALSELALRTRTTVVQGPLELVQGGKGLLFRRASFEDKTGRFLGFSGVVLDWDKEARFLSDQADLVGVRLGMRFQDSLGAWHQTANLPSLLRSDPRRISFSVLDARVELLAVQQYSWWEHLWPNALVFSLAAFAAASGLALVKSRARQHRVVEQICQAVFEQSLDAIVLFELRQGGVQILSANQAAVRLFGAHGMQELLGLNDFPMDASPTLQVDGMASREKAANYLSRTICDGQCEFEWLHRRLDDGELWLGQVSLRSLSIDGGSVLMSRVRDISESSRYQERLGRLASKYQALFEQSLDAILLMDTQARFLEANPVTASLYGVKDVAEFLTLGPQDFSPEYQPDGVLTSQRAEQVIAQAMRDGRCEFEWLHRRLDNGVMWLGQVSLRRIDLEEGPLLMVRVHDISASRRYEDKLRRLAFEDPLTALPNRAALLQELQQRCNAEDGASFALIHLDVDGFQRVNDSFGQAKGDQVLQVVADCLRQFNGGNTWVARLESDAFAVLLPDADLQRLKVWTDAARDWLVGGITARLDMPLWVTLSMGIARVQSDRPWQPQQLLNEASTALMEARQGGYAQIAYYSPAITHAAEQRLAMEQQLEQALKADDPPFVLLYQPKVDARGTLLGVEALLRWLAPDGSLIAPAQFISVAENSGHIHALGNWVINALCSQLAVWRQRRLPVPPVALNISAMQFASHPGWPPLQDQLLNALCTWQVPPAQLELEITETALLRQEVEVLAQLQALAEAKFRIAIDDFGTGFASLQLLKRLPVHCLKIDRCFVQSIVTDRRDQAIVQSIVQLAQQLHLQTVAEGVECPDQLQVLQSIGCEVFQGYLFAKPLAAADFQERFLNAVRAAP